MNYIEFQNTFKFLPVIPTIEIEKLFPGFDPNALTRWQKKGYIEKIRNGYYRLTSRPVLGDADLFFIANRIYQPSYVSLESALRWYDFIPEGVFTVTSISTRKTQTFKTPEGVFSYKSIRSDLFFGYRLEELNDFRFKMADPAKALLDFLYLHPHLETEDDFYELRLNTLEIKDRLNWKLVDGYLRLFASHALEERINRLKNFLADYDDIS